MLIQRLDQPDTVQHVAIGMDPHVEIGSENIMKLSYLLIPEEGVWLPDLPHIRQCEVFYLICIAVSTRDERSGEMSPAPPSFCLNCRRGSFHICLRVTWNLYSSTVQPVRYREDILRPYHLHVINVGESSHENVDENNCC